MTKSYVKAVSMGADNWRRHMVTHQPPGQHAMHTSDLREFVQSCTLMMGTRHDQRYMPRPRSLVGKVCQQEIRNALEDLR